MIKHATAIIGLGGLGCSVALALAKLSITNLVFIDADKVEEHNLKRQVLYNQSNIGSLKVNAAKKTINACNNSIKVSIYSQRITSTNANDLLKNIDIVVDCTDSVSSRVSIDNFCALNNVPLIYGGVKKNEGQVSLFNYNNGKSFSDTFDTKNLIINENCSDSRVIYPIVAITANYQAMQVFHIINKNEDLLLNRKLLCINVFNGTQKIFLLNQ